MPLLYYLCQGDCAGLLEYQSIYPYLSIYIFLSIDA